MNRLPLLVEGKETDIFVLQDAASMFLFGSEFAAHGAECPSKKAVARLFKQAWSHRQEWPAEIVLPGKFSRANSFAAVAREQDISVRGVPEAQMSFYILDVQSSFEEHAARDNESH